MVNRVLQKSQFLQFVVSATDCNATGQPVYPAPLTASLACCDDEQEELETVLVERGYVL